MKKFSCYIFARGGSKGIKNKNIIDINGKPLIYYTIKEAKKSKYINRIVVSTDDKKIKKIALNYKVNVINRPKKLSRDKSPELDAWKHIIEQDKKYFNNNDVFISLPTTSPMRNFKDIDKGIKKFLNKRHDIIIGITPSNRNPYLNIVKKINNRVDVVIGKKNFYRRQDVPKVYDITTSIYVTSKFYIKKCKKIMEGNVGYIEIPKERSIDIDDKLDLKIARSLIKNEK